MPNTNSKRMQRSPRTSKTVQKKQDIQRALMQKRKQDKNPITDYDLSDFRPKYGNKIKDVCILAKKTTKAMPVI